MNLRLIIWINYFIWYLFINYSMTLLMWWRCFNILMQSTANALHAQDFARWNSSSLLNARWVKRWLDRQSDLFKAKRKSLAAERKIAHDSKVLQTHFDEFKEMMIQYDITKNDTWNFDEIDYRMSIARFDWIVTVDSNRRIYFKDSNNRESLTSIECISEENKNISSMLIIVTILALPGSAL